MQLESKKILNNRKKYINEIVNSDSGQNSKPFKVKKLNKNTKSNNTYNLKMI